MTHAEIHGTAHTTHKTHRPHGPHNPLRLSLIALTAVLLSACTIYETESDGDRTDASLYNLAASRYLNPLYCTVQITHFFRNYLTYLQDSELAAGFYVEKFLGRYIDYPYEIDAEHFSSDIWGEITLGDSENEYVVHPDSYFDGPAYNVTFTSDSTYTAVCGRTVDGLFTYAEYDIRADVRITGDIRPIHITGLILNYTETIDGETLDMTVTSDDSALECYECYGSTVYMTPYVGSLRFTFSGRYATSFTKTY